MKKLSAFLLCTLFSILLLASASASTAPYTEASASTSALKRGDTATVTVKLTSSEKIKSMGLKFLFDTSVFEADQKNCKWLLKGTSMADFDASKSNAAMTYSSLKTAGGDIFKLTLKVKSDAPFGNYEVKIIPTLKNSDGVIDCKSSGAKLVISCTHSFDTKWSSDKNGHWYSCSVGGCDGKLELSEHIYDNSCDSECNVCNYRRSITHSYGDTECDGTYHWQVCTICGHTSDKAAHTPFENHKPEYIKTEADCVSQAVYFKSCKICGFKMSETFTYGTVDSKRHNDTYTVGAISPTDETDGYSGDTVCKNCGKTVKSGETVEKIGHKPSKLEAKSATAATEGNIECYYCIGCGRYYSDSLGTEEISKETAIIAKLPPEITDGNGLELKGDGSVEAVFRSNASFEDFLRVELDGKTLDASSYSALEGSIIITLKPELISALTAGQHSLGIVSVSGTAVANFTVTASEPAASLPANTEKTTNDDLSPAIPIIAACIILAAAVSAVFIIKRKKH